MSDNANGMAAITNTTAGGPTVQAAKVHNDGHTHETACLNCGTDLLGPHCHECGQHAHVHRTAGAFLHDLLHGALHFEGKIWRTLPLLGLRPGELTKRYIAGERARFVSPMALFLFCVFLMFAVVQIMGIIPPTDFSDTGRAFEQASTKTAALETEMEVLRREREAMMAGDPELAQLEGQILKIEKQIAGLQNVKIEGDFSSDTGVAFIDHAIEKWKKNPGLMAYKLQANSYKFSWLLIPLAIPFVGLLFAWRRKYGAYDHAVFVTYSLSFMTLFYVALVVLGAIGLGAEILGPLAVAIPLLHIYKQLKGAYDLSRFSAAWRTLTLTVLIFLILFVFIDVLLVLGALG